MTSEENQITVITPTAAESAEALPEKEKVPASVPSEWIWSAFWLIEFYLNLISFPADQVLFEFEFDWLSGWSSFVGIWFDFWLIEFWLNFNLISFLADWVLFEFEFDRLFGWSGFVWIWLAFWLIKFHQKIWLAFWLIEFCFNLIGFLADQVLFEFDQAVWLIRFCLFNIITNHWCAFLYTCILLQSHW